MKKSNKEFPQEEKDFLFPTELVEQIYELSGNAESHKGVILCVLSPKGVPQIYSRYDSIVTSLGMQKALDKWLDQEEEKLDTSDEE